MAEVENGTQTQNAQTPETNTQSTPQGQTQTQDTESLFHNLDEIGEKKIMGLIKSVLKSNDFKDEEISELLPQYRTHRENSKNKVTEQINTLTSQNEKLNKELFNIKIAQTASKVASEIGMKADRVDYALKNVDLSTMAPNGKIDNDKLKEALQKVLDEIPEFKVQDSQSENKTTEKDKTNTVRKVGVKSPETQTDDAMARFRRAMGLDSEK